MSSFRIDVPAGPLWNQHDAEEKARKIAQARGGQWTGAWNTVVPSQMSVINLELPVKRSGSYEFKTNVLAGPLWSNAEAQQLGPAIAASYGGEFTGQWTTITPGVMSIIEVVFRY